MATTRDEIQEKIELTPTQEKTFNSLIRAIKRCEKEKIAFYQVLNTLGALNGHNVIKVEDCIDRPDKDHRNFEPTILHWLDFPTIKISDAWADDTHFVKIRR